MYIYINILQAFRDDYYSLLTDLRELPKSVKVRKLNDITKRAKLVIYDLKMCKYTDFEEKVIL